MTSLKEHIKWIATYMVTWCFAKQLFLAIKLWGIENSVIHDIQLTPGILFATMALTGLIDGLIFGIIDVVFDHRIQRLRFTDRVLMKTAINLSVGLILTAILVPMLVGLAPLRGMTVISDKLLNTNLIILGVYTLLITFLLQLVKVAATWIHTFDLFQMFSQSGNVMQEDRIFMFLDMKSSTSHAERLGAEQYSLLIRDCFADMAKAAALTNAEIYQYVGDEAVFTWKTSDQNFEKSVQHYFQVRKNLINRTEYYRKQYGILPEFKAGIHHGNVIRTDVGVARRSVAFHGDAINTASRIQGKCNELGYDLLVSAAVLDGLSSQYEAEWLGNYQLRGKDREVSLFSIEEQKKADLSVLNIRCRQEVSSSKSTVPSFALWLNLF